MITTSSSVASRTPRPTSPPFVVNVMSPLPPAITLRVARLPSSTSIPMCAAPVSVTAYRTSRSPPPTCVKSITLLRPVTVASSVVSSAVLFNA